MKNKLLTKKINFMRHISLLLLMTLGVSLFGYAQVSGKITDASDGMPIPGVTVIVQGTNVGTSSDFDGNYTIEAKTGDVLNFTFIGLKSQTLIVSSTTASITMEQDAESLDEVIVVGYGSVKKKEVTGAVNRVKAKDIEQFVTSDIASRLQGQIAGVSVSASSGEPGEAANIQIRGITSLIGTNTPLFVVNGIPQIGDPGLSANEIETIDVLKDAASTAVYGSRGAAGVILITTKTGRDGVMSVDFDYSVGQQFLGVGTPLMNTADQLFYEINTANYFGGLDPATVNSPEWLGNDNTFDDYVLVDAAEVKTYNLNLSGGTEKFSYNASGSLYDQDGTLVNSNFKRYNGRISAQYNSGKWKINGSIATTNENRRRASAGLIVTASRYRPYFPEIDPDSDVAVVNSSGGTRTPTIALGQALKRKDNSNRDRTNVSLGIRRKLVENLDFITNVGSSITNDSRSIFRPKFDLFEVDTGETLSDPTLNGILETATRTTKFSWDAGLDFKKEFGKHSVSAQGVVTLEEDNNKTFSASIEGVSNNAITVLNGGTLNENVESGFNYTTKRVGTLGRIQYNYDGKYIVSALARYDGSSRFGRDYRWGTFPSIAAAWNVSSEPFWEPIKKVVNKFKIRLSHGQVGNDSFDDYEFASTIAPFADYIFDENDGSVDFGSGIRSYANRDVKWETSISNNIGVDISLFRNKVTLTADYYNTKKEDMLFPVTLPGSAGAIYDPTLTLNVGNMTNKGLELAANYRASIGKSNFRIGATFTTNDNEVTKVIGGGIIYNDNSSLISGDTDTYATTVIAEGYEAGAFFLYETSGTIKNIAERDLYRQFPSRANAEVGDLRYVDANGDGNITTEDKTYHGSGLADFEYGINFNWDIGRFDFSMNWFGTSGAEVLNGNKAAMYGWERHQDLVNQWTPDNPTSNIPSFQGRGREHPNYQGDTDYWLENGDYLRLKQVTLGFSLPEDTCDRIGLTKLRVYLSAQNPITITDYDGYDPEVGNNNFARRGIDQSRYPISSTYSLGVKLSF